MSNYQIYKLHFTTPLHLGSERDDYADTLLNIRSDTLYAALTSALAKTGGLPQGFAGDLGFTVSSLFPYYQKNNATNPVYFFPKSKKIEILPETMLEIHKDVKKIQYYDFDFFKEFLTGKDLTPYYTEQNLKGAYLTAQDIDKDFITTQIFPRVTVSRTGKEDAVPFYMERLFFKYYSGFWFMATGDFNILEKALKILEMEGIGTDRNVGNGYFEFSTDTQTLNNLSLPNSEYFINLSLFIPETKQQAKNALAYNLIKRGGWVTTHPHNTLRKNRIYAFEEGSLFKFEQKNEIIQNGKFVNLKPDLPEPMKIEHEIYRNGKAIFLPIKVN